MQLSTTTEFNNALRQFLKYQLALEEEQTERTLYSAVPFDTNRSFFSLELPRLLVQRYHEHPRIYESENGVIVEWHL